MKTIVYHHLEELDVHQDIKDSLLDPNEFSHIIEIDHVVYFILNYPRDPHLTNVLCISYTKETGVILYATASEDIQFSESLTVNDLLLEVLNQYEKLIIDVDHQLLTYETMINKLATKQYTLKLFKLEKQIMNYENALNSIFEVIDYIVNEQPEGIYEAEFSSVYRRLKIEINQINKKLDITLYTIGSMRQISESMFSNKLTSTMKQLTLITVLFAVPTFLTTLASEKILPAKIAEYLIPSFLFINLVLTLYTIYKYVRERKD